MRVSRHKLVSERQKALDAREAQMQERAAQAATFNENLTAYIDSFTTELRLLLKEEFARFPNIDIAFKHDYSHKYSSDIPYYILISYDSPKSKRSNCYRGVGWSVAIGFKLKRSQHSEVSELTPVLTKEPSIFTDLLESEDLPALLDAYNCLTKIESIDWENLLRKANAEVPKERDYVTTPYAPPVDTTKWDSQISQYDIAKTQRTDLWIHVNVRREDSFDEYVSNAGEVHGVGWMQLVNQTEKFYIFHWLAERRKASPTPNDDYYQSYIDYALRKEFKLKKIYFKVITPVELRSTEELTFNSESD